MKNQNETKNVTIKIENLVQEITICVCKSKKDKKKIKKQIAATLSKAVNDATLIVD